MPHHLIDEHRIQAFREWLDGYIADYIELADKRGSYSVDTAKLAKDAFAVVQGTNISGFETPLPLPGE